MVHELQQLAGFVSLLPAPRLQCVKAECVDSEGTCSKSAIVKCIFLLSWCSKCTQLRASVTRVLWFRV